MKILTQKEFLETYNIVNRFNNYGSVKENAPLGIYTYTVATMHNGSFFMLGRNTLIQDYAEGSSNDFDPQHKNGRGIFLCVDHENEYYVCIGRTEFDTIVIYDKPFVCNPFMRRTTIHVIPPDHLNAALIQNTVILGD